jgi:hypothetical protein
MAATIAGQEQNENLFREVRRHALFGWSRFRTKNRFTLFLEPL